MPNAAYFPPRPHEVKAFAGRTAEQKAAGKAQGAQRDAESTQLMSQARNIWATGNAADKAQLVVSPFFRNNLLNHPELMKEFGFKDATDISSAVNAFTGQVNLEDNPWYKSWGGTSNMQPSLSPATLNGKPVPSGGWGGPPAAAPTAGASTPPTYPLPGATPGQVPGTSWPSNNMPPGGPQQYFPPPNMNYLSSNNPAGATYQPTLGGGKMGGQPGAQPQGGKFG